MPLLDPESRQAYEQRLAVSRRIRDAFKDRQYRNAECRLCGWASNGLTPDEAWAANAAHERAHPEYTEWDSSTIHISDVHKLFHDHECQMSLCSCLCGCQEGPFCALALGPLCGTCTIRANRGGSAHAAREEPQP